MKPLFVYLVVISLLTTGLAKAAEPNPQRIVVSGGSITEIIYALDEQSRIVGVDSTSVFPVAAKQKPQIGYVRKISTEGILSLTPDLVLGEADTGPKKVVTQLQSTGVNMVILSDEDNFLGIENKINHVAELLNVPAKGQALANSLKADRDALHYVLSQSDYKPRVLFILSVRSGQPIVAGAHTSANELINAAGGINIVAKQLDNWKPLSTEAALAFNPDVIITMGRHGDDPLTNITKLDHFKFSNAAKNKQVYSFDGSYLLGMGPRTPQAVVELASVLHPKAKLPAGYKFRFAKTSETTPELSE
ncbi:ABC transporter substrate-binding protein [Pseudoalteromonas sp. Z9A5]|uniref:heme/hemin ABC transporter substrate-binding protein n=1 Tax=Pseudoalteromonas sp. Z9A5 TaxID=2686355 RepID=UPI0014094F6C|nr:ABC transporter substrate-binding protein [Pseudoalteromonas sp. Z9A5]